MQEEVENRAVTLVISATKAHWAAAESRHSEISGKPQGEAAAKARAAPEKPTGKQTVKQLIGQNQGVSNIEDHRQQHQIL